MFDRDDIFSDLFAQKENLLTGIEPCVKIAFTGVALAINLLAPNIYAPLGIAGFCLITLLAIRIPPRLLLLRLIMPLMMAVAVLLTQIFLHGTTPLFTLSLGGLRLVGFEEGAARGFLIMCRVVGGVSLLLFLTMTTPAHRLLMAATWLRVPKTLVELGLLVYRYIFVLIEEAITVRDAQKARLGYHNWRQSMRSLGVLGGTLVLRVYDRAERVFEAMLVRGYNGAAAINYRARFTGKDALTALGLATLLLAFFLVAQL